MPDSVSSATPSKPLRVAMLIPTFNRIDYVAEAIESVLDQDYEQLQILVLDDGSTDGTSDLLEEFGRRHPDARFRWTAHENMGQARTLNRGFEMVDAEIVGYLSSDDALLPGAISKLVDVFVAEPDVVVAYPAWESIDDEGNRIELVMPEEFNLVHALRFSDPVIGPGALLRRSVIDQVGGWNPDFVFSPDFEFWVRVTSAGEFRLLPEPLSLYRWHEGMTGRASKGPQLALERLAIVDEAFAVGSDRAELQQVKEEAYRAAFLAGAGILGDNAPWERFFIADRLAERIFPDRGASFREERDELRDRLAELKAELARTGDDLAALGDSLTRREMEVAARASQG